MRLARLALSSLLAFATACAASAEPADAVTAPIINGARETGYPEVVAVYWMTSDTAGGLCTGTVIGPYAILTAKHCVFQETTSGYTAVPASAFYVLVGDDIDSPTGITEVHYVREVRTTAGSNIDNDVSNGTDIAVLLLRDRIDITPRAVATSGPTPGEGVTVVGFGRTSTTNADSAGVKYRAMMAVDMVGMRQISADGSSWTCQGDSGGPMFDASGRVTGITSFGFGRDCRVSLSVFVRVAAFGSLISDALSYVPPCMPTAESCNGLDDDCNGSVDDGIGCTQPGQPCTDSAQCVRGLCESVGGSMVCTQTCFPDSPINCPSGTYCEVTGCGSGRCIPGGAGAGLAGTVCTADSDCASEYCAPLRGGSYCGEPCCAAASVFCGDSTLVCDLIPDGDGSGACIPPELAMGPRGFGSACDEGGDCLSGSCASPGDFCTDVCSGDAPCPVGFHCSAGVCAAGPPSGNGGPCLRADDCADAGAVCFEGACAQSCTDECPLGTVCSATADGMICIAEGLGLGEVCEGNAECRSGVCLTGVACTVLCDASTTCPEGYACEPAGSVSGCFRPGVRNAGGCSVLRGRGPARGALLVLGLLGLALARRRAR